MFKMTFQYINKPVIISPVPNIQVQPSLAISNPVVLGSIFEPIRASGPCSRCGK